MAQSKYWCYTLNNYTDRDLSHLSGLYTDGTNHVTYNVYGKEVADSGTPHLQGYIELSTRKRMPQLKTLLSNNTVHLETRRLSAKQAADYCKKDGDFNEYGSISQVASGARNDLASLRASIVTDHIRDLASLREKHPNVCAKYPSFVMDILHDTRTLEVLPQHNLYSWQTQLLTRLQQDPCDRKIIFIVDQTGNSGKTYMTKVLSRQSHVQRLEPCKAADFLYAFNAEATTVLIDVARAAAPTLQYTLLEKLKNGQALITKYQSRDISFTPPHVVVFMNEYPSTVQPNTLSEDRFEVYEIDDDNTMNTIDYIELQELFRDQQVSRSSESNSIRRDGGGAFAPYFNLPADA